MHDEHSGNTRLLRNALSAAEVQPFMRHGTVLDNQKALTVRSAFLQNARSYMDVFYRERLHGLEMEAGPYLSAIHETAAPKRHPKNGRSSPRRRRRQFDRGFAPLRVGHDVLAPPEPARVQTMPSFGMASALRLHAGHRPPHPRPRAGAGAALASLGARARLRSSPPPPPPPPRACGSSRSRARSSAGCASLLGWWLPGVAEHVPAARWPWRRRCGRCRRASSARKAAGEQEIAARGLAAARGGLDGVARAADAGGVGHRLGVGRCGAR
ncbi:MAG: hypothetical protein HS111_23380 [Kofleriaceae bacterium]|nr:hypothetical protein [Kofleriaceae bacterium]